MAKGYLYVIKDNQTMLTKIGITGNWRSRLKTLKVGSRTECRIVVEVDSNREWEKRLHKKYDYWRLVGTEWFKLNLELEQDLIHSVERIGIPVTLSKKDSKESCQSDLQCWWSTDQGREEAAKLIYNIDEDEIVELKVSNPWLDCCQVPKEEEWAQGDACVYFRFWHPKSLGGKLAEIFVEPDGTCEGSYFDYEDDGNGWMVQTFDSPPKGITDVIERLWILRKLHKSEWPLKVVTNWNKLKKMAAEAEEKAGPLLPKKAKEREAYLINAVKQHNEATAKAFCLAGMQMLIEQEWKRKGLDVAPDNPPFFFNAKIKAEAERRYANGFRHCSTGKWAKVNADGKWIDCTEDEASI